MESKCTRSLPAGPRFAALVFALSVGAWPASVRADEEPTQWEQLFYPFPIVGAPPQLEQQVQIFNNYFRGNQGSGDVPSAELGLILSPHWGLVVTVPYQIGIGTQPSGFEDIQVLAQYLVAGSLRLDNMISAGMQASFPTAQNDLGAGDYFVGPFVFAAQRFWHHFIIEANVSALLPVVHGDSARALAAAGLVSTLLTPRHFDYPVYAQVEVDTTTYLDGKSALPPTAKSTPAETVFIAPEVFIGPFKSLISDGTRVAAGVFFNLHGDPVHDTTYSVTFAFDIPNRYGY